MCTVGALSDMPDDMIERIAKAIYPQMSEAAMRKDLTKLEQILFQCYDIVFDRRWIQPSMNAVGAGNYEESNQYYSFYIQNSELFNELLNQAEQQCTEYIKKVRRYHTQVPAYDKTSKEVYMEVRQVARIEDLERLKIVLGKIFHDCEEAAKKSYERLMIVQSLRGDLPTENLHDLYSNRKFEDLKQSLDKLHHKLITSINSYSLNVKSQR